MVWSSGISSTTMAASQLYSTCLARTRFGACRALLLLSPRRIPRSLLQIQCAPLLVSVSSFHDYRHRRLLSPCLFARGTRCYCALNASSGSRDRNRSLSQAEVELDEEISRLERQQRETAATPASAIAREPETSSVEYFAVDVSSGNASQEEVELGEETSRPHQETVAKLSGSKAREQKKLALDLEGDANGTSSESTSGASRTKRSSKDQAPERTPLRKARLSESFNRSAGTTRNRLSPEVRQVVSVDEEDDGVMGSMLGKDFSSDEDLESDAESEEEARETKSGESSGSVQSSHPWEEWNAFVDVLHRKNYFKDVPKSALEGAGHLRFQNESYSKHAITEFGRERDDIIRFLTKKHIRIVVNIGCPSTDRKVVNAAKRLRMFCEIPEDEVCQQCKLKTFCTRAFAEPAPKIDAGTVDVVRVLYSFALNASPDAESQVAYPIGVVKSACHLLNEIVQLSAYPRDPGLPKAKSLSSANQLPVVKKATESEDPDRRPGDWVCPDCNFLNFSKNRECRECGTFKENAQQHLEPGDWECPECTFINFRRNKECRECLTPRPKSEHAGSENMEPGDWKCAECQFVNYRKNNECRRCSARPSKSTRPADVEELEPGDWRCPKCTFRNFRRNKECLECSTLRPVDDTDWTSTEPRNDHRWGLKKPLIKSDGGWGSSKSFSPSGTGSASSRLKYQEWKPDLNRHMDDDTDDDLEEDADIVYSKEDDETPLKSRRSSSQGTFSEEGSDNEFSFSDVEDEPPQRLSPKKSMVKRTVVSPKFVDDDDMSDLEDDLSDDDQVISKSTRIAKGRKSSFKELDDGNEFSFSDVEDDPPQRNSPKKSMVKKRLVSPKFVDDDDMSDLEDDLSDDDQVISKPTRFGKGRESSFKKLDDGISGDEGEELSDEEGYGGQNKGQGRWRGRDRFTSKGKVENDEGRKNTFGSGEMRKGRATEEKRLEGRGSSRTSSFYSDGDKDKSSRRGSMRSPRISSFSSNDESGRSDRRGSIRSPRTSSFSSNDDRFGARGSTRDSRTSSFSSDEDRSTRKGSMRTSFRGSERGRGGKRFEAGSRASSFSSDEDISNRKGSTRASFRGSERDIGGKRFERDTYSKTNSRGRGKPQVRGRR